MRYISQPTQKPVVAASSARPATIRPRLFPMIVSPRAWATVAEPSTAKPTWFANLGGRESSISPSPKRG